MLRDRCNVPLQVCTDRRIKLEPHSKDSTLIVARRRFSLSHGIQEVPRTPHDGLRKFVPYLYLFSPAVSAVTTTPVGKWTHVLRLLPSTKVHPAGTAELVDGDSSRGPRGLNLYIPHPNNVTGTLHLSDEHLFIARDFLALALPYYACGHPSSYSPPPSPTSSSSSRSSSPGPITPISHSPLYTMPIPAGPPPTSHADPVRVLILGPPRAVLAIALMYVAYASGCTVAHVMRGVLEDDEDLEWCRLLGKDGDMGLSYKEMRMLETVAIQEM